MSSLPPTCHFFFTNSIKSQIDKVSQLDLFGIAKCLIHEGVNQIWYMTEEYTITPRFTLWVWLRPRWQSRKSLNSPPLMNPANHNCQRTVMYENDKNLQKRSSTTEDIKKEPQWRRVQEGGKWKNW